METADMRQEIVLTLRRHGPLRLSGIANKIHRSESGVYYQLQKMEKEGLVVCTEEKHYRLADTKEIEKAILQVTKRRTLPPEQILQAEELKSFDKDKVKAVFDKMIITGLLEKVEELTLDETGLFKTVEKGYKLSFLGCRELEVCYFCNEPVREIFAIEGIVSERSWVGVDYGLPLHPTCIAKWIESDWGMGEYYFIVASCNFCGLPINANDLIGLLGYRNAIELSDMERYLSSEEGQALRDETEQPSPLYATVRYIEDRSDIEEIVSNVVKRAKERNIKLEEYDQQLRTDQLWAIAQKLIEQKESKWDNMLRLCGPLLEPISILYSQLPTYWAHNLKRYEIFTTKDRETGLEREEMMRTTFLKGAHSPVMIHGGKQYHLYCYRLAKEFGMLSIKQGASE